MLPLIEFYDTGTERSENPCPEGDTRKNMEYPAS